MFMFMFMFKSTTNFVFRSAVVLFACALMAPQSQADRVSSIALLGCLRQYEPAPALAYYAERDFDLCLWVGDNIYADTMDDPAVLESCYDLLGSFPSFQLLKNKAPFLATWDDHDFGYNNAGKEYPLKAYSKDLFRRFWGLEQEIPACRDGVYFSKIFPSEGGTLQVILLDVRYNRDLPFTDGTVLGESQWSWLESELQRPADLRLLVSGFQYLLPHEAGSETWDQYPKEMDRLCELIKSVNAEGVLLITGDQHYGEVARMRGAFGYDAVEVQFAGINQIETQEHNPYRVTGPMKSLHSMAELKIQWESTEVDVPHVLFEIHDTHDMRLEVSYRINLSELRTNLKITPSREFLNPIECKLDWDAPKVHCRYTTDGESPTSDSALYSNPVQIFETTRIRAQLFDDQARPIGKEVVSDFVKADPIPGVDLASVVYQPGLWFSYYEGNFNKLPDFKQLTPVYSGTASNWDLKEIAQREDHFALKYEGWIYIDETDYYEFRLTSDDGSQLLIHDLPLIVNDGSHSKRAVVGGLALKLGWHPICVEYFEDYMGQKLLLEIRNNKGAFQVTQKRQFLSRKP